MAGVSATTTVPPSQSSATNDPASAKNFTAAVTQAKDDEKTPVCFGPTPAPPDPRPGPAPTTPPPGHPQAGGDGKWPPPDKDKINALITKALKDNHGDVSKAFAELRNQRDEPANYYNTNLAIAADYLRARWDTQQYGPEVAWSMNQAYMELKGVTGVPHEGPGPVSPKSPLEKQYMDQGVSDEWDQMPLWKKILSVPAAPTGAALAVADQIPGVRDVSHAIEDAPAKIGSWLSHL